MKYTRENETKNTCSVLLWTVITNSVIITAAQTDADTPMTMLINEQAS